MIYLAIVLSWLAGIFLAWAIVAGGAKAGREQERMFDKYIKKKYNNK